MAQMKPWRSHVTLTPQLTRPSTDHVSVDLSAQSARSRLGVGQKILTKHQFGAGPFVGPPAAGHNGDTLPLGFMVTLVFWSFGVGLTL